MSGAAPWGPQPVVYEVNTLVWLRELGRRAGAAVDLATVSDGDWDSLVLPGVDAVWLMGVWERSPAGLAIAHADAGLQASFRDALGDVGPDDVTGSPYCVRRYVVDDALGGPDGLAAARAALARRGLRLLLDYVPNHVAPDHPWVLEHPDRFVRGGQDDLAHDPGAFLSAGDAVLALGRDPYFPPWPDVVQLDAFSPGLRAAATETLVDIGRQCDGVRCDMAMLMVNDVFTRTWGDRVGPPPDQEYWPEVLAGVKAQHPDMLFIAEAYWDMEWTLQQQGFDHCYDKRLYDRLLHDGPLAVRGHLQADLTYQRKLVRFLENHDEPRIASLLTGDAERVAAVATATLPGAQLWHEGELEGRRVRIPVFLTRRPDEPVDAALREFHHALLAAVDGAGVREGEWQLLEVSGWPDNPTHDSLVAWSWSGPRGRHVVVVNLSDGRAQGHVRLRWDDLRGRGVELAELLEPTAYERVGDDLLDTGLYVDLPARRWHLLSVGS